MKEKIGITLLALCLLAGCGEEGQETLVPCVAAEDCVLCGRGEAEPWGQNNVGLVSLNTFDMVPIEINRYDSGGGLIEENTGTFKMRNVQGREGGFHVSMWEDSDRGFATLTVTLGGDVAMDREKAAAFLCEDCLTAITPEGRGKPVGLGAVDFATGEVRAFDPRTRGFGMGDFYFHCDWNEKGESVGLLLFYCPLRYGEKV